MGRIVDNHTLRNRALVQAARAVCTEYGAEFATLSDEWVVRMRKGAITTFVIGYNLGCNSQAAARIAVDKVATFQLLRDAGVPAVPHYLLKTLATPAADKALLQRMIYQAGKVVVKPLEGGSGAHIMCCDNVADAITYINAEPVEAWVASPYVQIAKETRVVVLRGKVCLVYEKSDPHMVNGLPMFNLRHAARGKGVVAEALPTDMRDMAIVAMQAIGLALGAVDIVTDEVGRKYVLEINGAFSLEHYAASSTENRHQVVAMYVNIFRDIFGREFAAGRNEAR